MEASHSHPGSALRKIAMKIKSLLACSVLLATLAGCFTSSEPLITTADADFPFEKIVYAEEDGDTQTVLQRTADGYVPVTDDAEPVTFLFRKVGEDAYVVQVSGTDSNDVTSYLYAYLKVDLAAGTAKAYKAIAEDSDTGPGLERCDDGTVCLTALQPFIDHAVAAIAAGEEADTTYRIVETE